MLTINNTVEGYLKDVEIKGNTWQDSENLADIRSVGDKVEGQELYEIPVLSVGGNLFNINSEYEDNLFYFFNTGNKVNDTLRRSYIVPVKEGMSVKYINSKDIHVTYYTKDGIYISGEIAGDSRIRVVPKGTYFAKFGVRKDVGYEYDKLCVCESSFANDYYEPYIEDKLTILSPTPLEKVGDVADRIICKDGVWGVEKNIASFNFNGTESWHDGKYPTANHISYRVIMPSRLKYTTQYDTKFICSFNGEKLAWFDIYSSRKDVQGAGYGDNGYFYIRVPNSKTLETFKQDLSNNPVRVLGLIEQPTFIPLPHSQQIKLRTFADRTHISFDTEIEGAIKAQVPKSLGATVNTHTSQIDNLNKELDRVKKLEESAVSTVTSSKAFTTVSETNGGYFEDVKIEGRTLVNLCKTPINFSGNSLEGSANRICSAILSKNTVIDKEYTIVLNITKDEPTKQVAVQFKGDSVSLNTKWINNSGIHKFKIKANNTYDTLWVYGLAGSGITYTIKDVIILEGDHTDKDLSYFEGLKSVGQDSDEISVESVNENLWAEGDLTISSDSWNKFEFKYQFKNNTSYTIVGKHRCNADSKNPRLIFKYTDGTESTNNTGIATTTLTEFSITSDSNKTIDSIKMTWSTGGTGVNYELKDVMLSESNPVKPYTIHKQDKKQILYYNPTTQTWEKPVLREWDSIEKHSDGKYYYHKRSGETSFVDSSIGVYREDDVYISFSCTGLDGLTVHSPNIICNMINTIKSPLVANEECMYCLSNNYIYIKILKSRLSTQNAEGFRQWLQANNVTVVYQLAQEEVYECTNLDLITYSGETNLIVSSGAIQPKITLKVLSNVSNVVKLLQEKVSILENNTSSYIVTQNRLQLASTYAADSVTFKVDYASAFDNRSVDGYNPDLYNLILSNILVGKDNYDYDKMFSIILDYASWDQISWEQFDELVLLMDIQHNPPIEIPEEDYTEEEIPEI